MYYRHWPCWSSSEIMSRYRGVIKSMDGLKTSDQTLTVTGQQKSDTTKKWPFLGVCAWVYVHFPTFRAFSFWHHWSRGAAASPGLGARSYYISESSHFTTANSHIYITVTYTEMPVLSPVSAWKENKTFWHAWSIAVCIQGRYSWI